MTKEKGKIIDDVIGRFLRFDMYGDSRVKCDCLCTKVQINTRKPLRRGVMLKVDRQSEAQWFFLGFERLPIFCY